MVRERRVASGRLGQLGTVATMALACLGVWGVVLARIWKLVGADGQPYDSPTPGTFGGYRRTRIYGRLDCPSALRAIARGGYVAHRVFFADDRDAAAAGYRPCAVCLPDAYARWKAAGR